MTTIAATTEVLPPAAFDEGDEVEFTWTDGNRHCGIVERVRLYPALSPHPDHLVVRLDESCTAEVYPESGPRKVYQVTDEKAAREVIPSEHDAIEPSLGDAFEPGGAREMLPRRPSPFDPTDPSIPETAAHEELLDIIERARAPEVAMRFNSGKPDLSYMLEFARALRLHARNCTFGEAKYNRGNWRKGFPPEQLFACGMRHIQASYTHLVLGEGDGIDPDSGLHHLAGAIWNLMVLAELHLTDETADRFESDAEWAEFLNEVRARYEGQRS